MDEVVAWGLDLARDLGAFGRGELDWADVDKGCLLSGPPGCGKTLFARALAETCRLPLVSGSYGSWLGSGHGHQGDLLKAMAKSFAEARSKAPSILFIDEIDSFPNRSTITHHYADWEIQVVNALLAEIDGVEGREGVVLVGACNHPEKLDPALVRSGRLDRHFRVSLPNCAALERIMREHLSTDLDGVSLAVAALAAAGSSGADCERLVRGARRRARSVGRAVAIEDLMAEIGGDDPRPLEAVRVAAVHEAGHGVTACVLRPGALQALTLRSNGDEGGLTSSRWSGDLVRAKDVNDRLTFLLAGRPAEEVLFGEPSAGSGGGAASDLASATWLAVHASTSLGFDANAGLVWSGRPDIATLPELMAADPDLRQRVRQALDSAYADALRARAGINESGTRNRVARCTSLRM